MLKMSDTEKKLPEINILLLGETGAGKSTTLNALANYFRYDFKSATLNANPFTILEPFEFVRTHPETDENMIISSGPAVGNNNNVRNSIGHSRTACTVGYSFEFENRCRLRFIDTPGIGDTDGQERDKENFENIMDYLEHHDELHAVVIVVSGSSNRRNAFFKYCIAELLTRLHRSVSRNVYFLFTRSRDTNFGRGDGFEIMQSFIAEGLGIQIELSLRQGENCFFIDNTAFTFLIAKKRGYPLDQLMEESCQNDWDKSVKQIKSMIEHIMRVGPHDLQSTKLLNEARRIIIELSQPMVEIELNIRNNIESIASQKRNSQLLLTSPDNLLKKFTIELDVVKLEEIKKPATVCASKICTQMMRSKEDGQNKEVYRRCHENCRCLFVTANTKKQLSIYTCEAIGISGRCKKCLCKWSEHMHIYANYIIETMKLIDADPDKIIKELEAELKEIEDCNCKFAFILSTNSRLSHNKYYLNYLELQIEQKYDKPDQFEALKKIKTDYKKNVDLFQEANKNKSAVAVKLEDIPKLKERLFALNHSGPQFKQILKLNKKIRNNFEFSVSSVPMSNLFYQLMSKFF